MKKRRLLLCLICISIYLFPCVAHSQEVEFEDLVNAIESSRIEFAARQANPAKGNAVNLTTFPNNTLIFTKDGSQADLPYFGRAMVAGYGTDTGVVFNGQNEDLKVKENEKKKKVIISFRVKSKSDFYRCNLTLFTGGSATLTVVPNNRDRINFIGSFEIK